MPIPSLSPDNPWPNRAHDSSRRVGRAELSTRMNESVDVIGGIDRLLSETAGQVHQAVKPDIFAEGGLLHDPGDEGEREFDRAMRTLQGLQGRSHFGIGSVELQMIDNRRQDARVAYGDGTRFKMKEASRDVQVGSQDAVGSQNIQRDLASWHHNPEKLQRFQAAGRASVRTRLRGNGLHPTVDLFEPLFDSDSEADVDALDYQESVLGHRRVAELYGAQASEPEQD